jgi:hypothetical protein
MGDSGTMNVSGELDGTSRNHSRAYFSSTIA